MAAAPRPAATTAVLPTSSAAKYGAASVHHVEHAGPARLVKEVNDDINQPAQAVSDCLALIFVSRRNERPVDEHGAANDVFEGHKAPIAAVQAHVAVVPHRKDAVRRNHQIAVLDEGGKLGAPLRCDVLEVADGSVGEVVAIVQVVAFTDDVRLIQPLAVAIHRAILEVNAISGESNHPLHNVEAGLRRG